LTSIGTRRALLMSSKSNALAHGRPRHARHIQQRAIVDRTMLTETIRVRE